MINQPPVVTEPIATEGFRPSESQSTNRFRHAQAVALLPIILLTITLYWSICRGLVVNWWIDPNYSHGFLVPLFSGWMVWRNRHEYANQPTHPSWWGFPIVVFALLTLIVGVLGSEVFLARSSLILLIGGVIISLRGWPRFRVLFNAWVFLFLMIPIPAIVFNPMVVPLQRLASGLAGDLLAVFGVSVLREGNVIYLPSVALEVGEACSGIRSLISLTTLALMYGYLVETNRWNRLVLAVAALPIAIIVNALRIVITGLCVQLWDADKALGFFHEFSGFFMYFVSFAMLIIVHGVLQKVRRAEEVRP